MQPGWRSGGSEAQGTSGFEANRCAFCCGWLLLLMAVQAWPGDDSKHSLRNKQGQVQLGAQVLCRYQGGHCSRSKAMQSNLMLALPSPGWQDVAHQMTIPCSGAGRLSTLRPSFCTVYIGPRTCCSNGWCWLHSRSTLIHSDPLLPSRPAGSLSPKHTCFACVVQQHRCIQDHQGSSPPPESISTAICTCRVAAVSACVFSRSLCGLATTCELAHQVGLVEDEPVSVGDLLQGLVDGPSRHLIIQALVHMLGIHHGHNAILQQRLEGQLVLGRPQGGDAALWQKWSRLRASGRCKGAAGRTERLCLAFTVATMPCCSHTPKWVSEAENLYRGLGLHSNDCGP